MNIPKINDIDLTEIQDINIRNEVSDIWKETISYIDKQIVMSAGLPLTVLLNNKIGVKDKTYTLDELQCILEERTDK